MPNMNNATKIHKHKILVLGDTGSGKTTQFLTLPGKKFIYIFDPNATMSLRGHDVDYEEFLPENLNLAVTSLSKDKRGGSTSSTGNAYVAWERDFDEKVQSGFFNAYENIGIDSATTLLDIILDRVLSINGRAGQYPQQDDWPAQMLTFTSICRTLTGMGKLVYMTGHLDIKQDDLTKRIFRRPMMTGRLQTKIPLLFSDIFIMEASPNTDSKGPPVLYQMQTVPDRMTTNVRTSIKGLEPFENITIDWSKSPIGQGLGGILQWEQKQLEQAA